MIKEHFCSIVGKISIHFWVLSRHIERLLFLAWDAKHNSKEFLKTLFTEKAGMGRFSAPGTQKPCFGGLTNLTNLRTNLGDLLNSKLVESHSSFGGCAPALQTVSCLAAQGIWLPPNPRPFSCFSTNTCRRWRLSASKNPSSIATQSSTGRRAAEMTSVLHHDLLQDMERPGC
jgi:hypothetical protein